MDCPVLGHVELNCHNWPVPGSKFCKDHQYAEMTVDLQADQAATDNDGAHGESSSEEEDNERDKDYVPPGTAAKMKKDDGAPAADDGAPAADDGAPKMKKQRGCDYHNAQKRPEVKAAIEREAPKLSKLEKSQVRCCPHYAVTPPRAGRHEQALGHVACFR